MGGIIGGEHRVINALTNERTHLLAFKALSSYMVCSYKRKTCNVLAYQAHITQEQRRILRSHYYYIVAIR